MEIEPFKEDVVRKTMLDVSKWSMRGIGYSLIGSTLASYANIMSVQLLMFGNDGVQTYEAMATLGVGGLFVFIGEFLANYVQSLKAKGRYSRSIIRELEKIENNLSLQNKKYEQIIELLARHMDDGDFGIQGNP